MGDRCDMQVTLRGHIETIEILEQVIDALVEESGIESDYLLDIIRQSLDQNTDPAFSLEEVNYGRVTYLEEVLQRLRIDYTINHSDGGSYPGQAWSYNSKTRETCTTYHAFGDDFVYLSDIEKLLEAEDDLVENVKALVKSFDVAAGKGLPDFSASHEVRGWLTIDGPKLQSQTKHA